MESNKEIDHKLAELQTLMIRLQTKELLDHYNLSKDFANLLSVENENECEKVVECFCALLEKEIEKRMKKVLGKPVQIVDETSKIKENLRRMLQ